MKKVASLLLALLLCLSLFACNSGAPANSPAPASPPASEAPNEPPAGNLPNFPTTLDVDVSKVATDPGFTKVDGAEDFLIGISIRTLANPYFYAEAQKVEQYLKELGFKTTGVMDNGEDLDTEYANIEQMIAQGVDLIICDGVQPGASAGAAQLALSAGIPFIAIDVDLEDAPSFNVVCNSLLNGFLAGYHLGANYLKGETINDIHIGGFYETAGPGADRARGMFAGIVAARLGLGYAEAFPIGSGMFDDVVNNGKADNEEADFHVLGVGYAKFQESLGLSVAEDLLVAYKDKVNCMTGENDIMLLGAFTAVENLGLQDQIYMVAGSDAYSVAIKQMMDNPKFQLVAVGINSPYMVAAAACNAAVDVLIKGVDTDSMPQHIWASEGIVTKANAAQAYNPDSIF